MSERFLIEAKNSDGLPVTNPQETRSEEGYLKDLTVEGILEILTGGMIKNTAETYLIDDSGVTLFGTGDIETKMNGDAFQIGTVSGGWIASLRPTELNISLSAFPGNRIKITSDEIKFFNAGGLRGTIAGFVGFSDTTNATNKDTGAITTEGGIGVEKDIFVGGKATVANTTDSTSKDTGAIITEGGIGVEKSVYAGGKIVTADTTESTSTTTGSMQTAGGLGVAKNLHVGGQLIAPKVIVKFIEGFDTPYAVLSNDVTLLCDTSVDAIDINLPAGTEGRKITVKHIIGTAATEPITINRAGSDTIEGNTSYVIDTDLGHVTLVFYAGVWYIIPI